VTLHSIGPSGHRSPIAILSRGPSAVVLILCWDGGQSRHLALLPGSITLLQKTRSFPLFASRRVGILCSRGNLVHVHHIPSLLSLDLRLRVFCTFLRTILRRTLRLVEVWEFQGDVSTSSFPDLFVEVFAEGVSIVLFEARFKVV
jgi:hypothetical protein